MINELRERARYMRINATDAENCMWFQLRNRQLCGVKFSRQFMINPYIVDFICREKMLIIKIDGGQHLSQVEYDNERTKFLNAQGYKVLRFWNDEVLKDLDIVLDVIVKHLNTLTRR
jgi:very-short-patch-repair endonuclease